MNARPYALHTPRSYHLAMRQNATPPLVMLMLMLAGMFHQIAPAVTISHPEDPALERVKTLLESPLADPTEPFVFAVT